MKTIFGLFCLSFIVIANVSYVRADSLATASPIHYKIVGERSHKSSLFTQGLLVKDGIFYESSGLYKKSQIVSYPVTEPEGSWARLSAPFAKKQPLPDRFFAEGLTLLDNKLYLLTWQEGTLFVYDATHFTLLKSLPYKGEGWGLATDGKSLIRSDGSAKLFFHNPDSFAVEKNINVKFKQQPISNLNELEYAEGFIWANIWHDNRVVKINPASGEVVGVVDFSDIITNLHLNDPESVLNGIAYDADKKAFWITGKQWPKMFLVKLQ